MIRPWLMPLVSSTCESEGISASSFLLFAPLLSRGGASEAEEGSRRAAASLRGPPLPPRSRKFVAEERRSERERGGGEKKTFVSSGEWDCEVKRKPHYAILQLKDFFFCIASYISKKILKA